MNAAAVADGLNDGGSSHGALIFSGQDEYLRGVLPFIREGLKRDEAVMVNADVDKADLLRSALGSDAAGVEFNDMRELGANPARIIPVWLTFVEEQAAAGRRVRGTGEPSWPGRTPAAYDECALHEALLNVLAPQTEPADLLCTYDSDRLPTDVITGARRTHPTLVDAGTSTANPRYDAGFADSLFRRPLDEPPAEAAVLPFDIHDLSALRGVVAGHARAAGLDDQRAEDLILASTEAMANSIRYGGGCGSLHLWATADEVVVDVRDTGTIDDPLVGRITPAHHTVGGRGLWIINQLCDLVQIRSPEGAVHIRLHMRRP